MRARATLNNLTLTALFGLLISTAAAQNGGFEAPGDHWFEWSQNNHYVASLAQRCDMDKALFDQFTRTLQRLGTTWARTPGSAGPELYARMQGVQNSCKGQMKGEVIYWPWPVGYFRMEPVPEQPGKTRPHFTNETLPLHIYVNKLDGLTSIWQLNADDKEDLGYVKVSHRFAGYPVYNLDHVLLIPAPGRDPFVPVSLDEALHAWLNHCGENDWGRPGAEALLGRLNAGELQKPAYYYQDSLTSHRGIVAAPGPDTVPVVRYNPDYFDKTKPRWVPQILSIDVHFLDLVSSMDDSKVQGPHKFTRHMLEATDWRQMAAELMH